MESAKQNVPETLVQGGGITPKVNLSIPAGQPDDKQYGGLKCRKCNYSLQAGWKSCPFCGEPVVSIPPKCGCGASLEAGWKVCPFCGKPVAYDQ
jgi:RNA polymerase subunit RPABC4/transcription elongation factor Spt4